jgi:hypothetical protein
MPTLYLKVGEERINVFIPDTEDIELSIANLAVITAAEVGLVAHDEAVVATSPDAIDDIGDEPIMFTVACARAIPGRRQ